MKDKELEKAFGGYFDGVNAPDNLTADAKKQVKKHSAFLPSFVKYASVAASFILVVAVGAVLLSRNLFPAEKSSGSSPAPLTYADGQISKTEADAYTLSKIDKSLEFIQNLAYYENAAVTAVEVATFDDNKTVHVRAEISFVTEARYDAEVYVEFSEYVYAPLAEYAKGESGNYRGINYNLIRTTDETSGEILTTLYTQKDGVKYYFRVLSSDLYSYQKCLQLLL